MRKNWSTLVRLLGNYEKSSHISSPYLYQQKGRVAHRATLPFSSLRGQDSNLRPPGYEPDEMPLLYPAIERKDTFVPFLVLFGDYLLSQAVSNQVPSAMWGLTSVFGMGTGVSPALSSPYSLLNKTILIGISGQMFERLVSVSSTYYYASTSDLSTGFSSRSLRNLILRGASRLDAFSAYPVRT